jgi:hypothetical protein
VFFLFVWTLTTHGKYSVSGDEPHYLIVAHSLVTDGDLDVANNYARNDGVRFGHDGLQPERHARRTQWGGTWSVHDVGLPVLLAPVYAAAAAIATEMPEDLLSRVRQSRGLFAYSLVSLSILALAAWGVSLFLSGLLRIADRRAAVWTAAGLAFVPPFLAHSFLVFPDIVAAVVVCAVVWLLCLETRELTLGRVLMVALAVGLLPWLHRRFAPLGAGVALVVIDRHAPWFRAQRPGPRAALAGLVVLPAVALYLLMWIAWGNVGGPQGYERPFSGDWIPRGALGLLLDRERGLLAYSPLYLLLPACWVLGWRRHWPLAVPVLLVFVPAAAFVEWFAGFSPAARYLVPVVPLLLVPAADALTSPRLRRLWVILGLFQAVICAVVWQMPRTLWPQDQGTNLAMESIPLVGWAYARALPSVFTSDSLANGLGAAAALAAATLAIVLVERTRGARPAGGTDPAR